MSSATKTLSAALALTLGFALTADLARAQVPCFANEWVNTFEATGVTHGWSPVPTMRRDAYNFAQTVSHLGRDAGAIRMAGDNIRYQESGDGSHGKGETVHVFSVCALPDGDRVEMGSFEHTAQSQTTMQTVHFENHYDHPVFFAQVVTHNGSNPIVATPIRVDSTSALIALMEPDAYDGSHGAETVHWMVLEEGPYVLPDGRKMEVDVVDVTTKRYDAQGMTTIVPVDGSEPVFAQGGSSPCFENARILTQPQTLMAVDWHGTRVEQDVDADGVLRGFGLRHMFTQAVEESNDPPAVTGPIGYVVIGDSSDVGCRDTSSHLWDGSGHWGGLAPAEFQPQAVSSDLIAELCGEGGEIDLRWRQYDGWGNSTVGADYDMNVGFTDDRRDVADGQLWIGGSADAHITLFGESLTVFDVGAQATTEADGTNDSRVWLMALGGLWSWDQAGVASFNETLANYTFFEASAIFYGVTVSASAVGELGVSGTATLGGAGLSLDATPSASLSAEASASIGVACVNAGISASLTLVAVDVPIEGSTAIYSDYVEWSMDASLELTTLGGSLDLDVEWCIGSSDYELFSIDGKTRTFPLLAQAGCF